MANKTHTGGSPLLLPCPFCGGKAERIDIDDGQNIGGSCISCTKCQASSNVEFGFKENFVSNWNRRSVPYSPCPTDGERLNWIDGLPFADLAKYEGGWWIGINRVRIVSGQETIREAIDAAMKRLP